MLPPARAAHCRATFTLQSLRRAGDEWEQRVSTEFFIYGTRTSKDKSGAYLFLPDGEAKVQGYWRVWLAVMPTAMRQSWSSRLSAALLPHSPMPPRIPPLCE